MREPFEFITFVFFCLILVLIMDFLGPKQR